MKKKWGWKKHWIGIGIMITAGCMLTGCSTEKKNEPLGTESVVQNAEPSVPENVEAEWTLEEPVMEKDENEPSGTELVVQNEPEEDDWEEPELVSDEAEENETSGTELVVQNESEEDDWEEPELVSEERATEEPLKDITGTPMEAAAERMTGMPTEESTETPAEGATGMPTEAPTEGTTGIPTEAPEEGTAGMPTEAPEEGAAGMPTEAPEEGAAGMPTEAPEEGATEMPTDVPTEEPTKEPVLEKIPVVWDPSWMYADNSSIHTGEAVLYHFYEDAKVIAVNAGHGTVGGSNAQTLCHPDGSSKVTGGSTASGATYATAVSGGTTMLDGTAEAEVNFRLAQIVRDRLLENGFNVLMIRDAEDVQLDNVARTVMANENADCHIALHYDSTENDKGFFYIGVPDVASYKDMEPVASHWMEHNRLGESVLEGMRTVGRKICGEGNIPLDLTQTSYSTIPSMDLEVGDRGSDYSEESLEKIAEGIVEGLKIFWEE